MYWKPRVRRSCRSLTAAALAAALLAPPVVAQDAARKAAPAKSAPKAKPNVMTRDELRACMNEQDRLQGMRTRVEQEQAALDRQKAEVVAMDAELQKKIASIDPNDETARKALETEGAQRDQAADAYNARVAQLREQALAFDSGRQAWVQRCTNRDFDEMDEAAIKKERRAAKK